MNTPEDPTPRDAADNDQPETKIKEIIGAARMGEPVCHAGLSVYPLFTPDGHEPDYLLLEDALREKLALISEASQSGSVPELLIDNRADLPILILEGDVLIGAKQNRVVNLTVLVPPKTILKLPVSCVERGRWHYMSEHFSIKRSAHPDLRGAKISSVLMNRKRGGNPQSDQMEVWDKVDHCLQDLAAASPTDSLEDGYAVNEARISTYRDQLHLPEDATGFMVAIGGRVVGFDLFGEAATARRCWGRLAESYLLEALRRTGEGPSSDAAQAREFLQRVGHATKLCPQATGLGQEVEVESPGIAGMGLTYAGRLVHMAAFALN